MASKIINIEKDILFNPKQGSIDSQNISKTFGRGEDHIEVHIYDLKNNLLQSILNYDGYTFSNPFTPPSTPLSPTDVEPLMIEGLEGAGERDHITPGPNEAKSGYWFNTGQEKIWISNIPLSANTDLKLSNEINLDPESILKKQGYTTGKYKVKVNIKRKKIFNTNGSPFNIKEISPNRREIRVTTPKIPNNTLSAGVGAFISEIESSIYFKDFHLSFGEDINILGINILLNKNTSKYEVFIKTLDPLPTFISNQNSFSICEYIVDPVKYTVDLGYPETEDNSIPLRGPNTKIDIRLHNSIPSKLKNHNQILEYGVSSSYYHLINKLENEEIPEVDYDFIPMVSESRYESSYHFENFIHFGSATERLKNFEYKIDLIETYNSQSGNLDKVPLSTSSSIRIKNNKEEIEAKKGKILKGFDGYEQFLYYNSGSFASWPKSNVDKPYKLHSVTSSAVKTWLGHEVDTYGDYGGQLLSASLFDSQNNNALKQLIPNHILTNSDNNFYLKFVNMVGQHFDQIWLHIKHLTKIHDTHHTRGISKDLVYFTLKSLGLETFDQFENANLIEYILGEGTQDHRVGELIVGDYLVGGTTNQFFDTQEGIKHYVSASNEGSLPKGQITREIWKRLYHNAPYLLKTKGTERGLRALMNCYGVPSSMLNVKEYGGPTKDKSTYKTFTYDKSSLALKGDSGTEGYFLKTDWSSNLTNALSSSAKTVEFRIKPKRSDSTYHLFSLSGSNAATDPHLVLSPYGGNDISSSGDSPQYGKLDLYINGAITASTNNFPIYNGSFWNIHIGTNGTSGSGGDIHFGAYQSNWLKNTSYYKASVGIETEFIRASVWGDPHYGGIGNSSIYDGTNNDDGVVGGFQIESYSGSQGGAANIYIGGIEPNINSEYNLIDGLRYSGSLQEVRYHFGELLTHDTLVKHSLGPFIYGGNQISSSYETVVARFPLGSNLHKDSSSFHPNIEQNYLKTNKGPEQITNPTFNNLQQNGTTYTVPGWNIQDYLGGNHFSSIPNGIRLHRNINTGASWQLRIFQDLQKVLKIGNTYTLSFEARSTSQIAGFIGKGSSTFVQTGGTTGGTMWSGYNSHTFTTFTSTFLCKYNDSDQKLWFWINSVNPGDFLEIRNVSLFESITSKSSMTTQLWEELDEIHHLPTPDTGIATTSEKVRIDTGIIDDDILSHNVRSETSTLDRQPQDFEDLGVFFSPSTEINEDIIYTLGPFRLDDYIGNPLPSAQTSSIYNELKELKEYYFKKIDNKFNFWDYLKMIQYTDHTLFKLIEQWVPFKTNLKTGLVIEPHYLERSKVKRVLPVFDDAQTAVPGSYNTFDLEFTTHSGSTDKFKGSKLFKIDSDVGGGSMVTTMDFKRTLDGFGSGSKEVQNNKGRRVEQGTNATLDITSLYGFDDDIAQAPIKPYSGSQPQGYKKHTSNTLMGNVQKGRKSNRYYYSLAIGNQNDIL